MKHKIMGKLSILLSLSILISLFPLNAQAKTITSNETGIHGGYNYEYWKDKGNGTMELKDGGTFSCEWDEVNNILFMKGLRFDKTKTHQEIGDISITYDCNFMPDGNSYLGVYGWTTNPLVEYYIIESWGTWKPPGSSKTMGTLTIDGGVYDIFEFTRTRSGGFAFAAIMGRVNYKQYYSVRQEKRTSGTVSVSEHFKALEALGAKMGKLYDVNFTVEGYQSRGKADVTEMYIDIEPYPTILGDVNSDKKVDALDFGMLRLYLIGSISSVSANADVNQDGSIDSIDFGMLRKHLLGMIKLGTTTPTTSAVTLSP